MTRKTAAALALVLLLSLPLGAAMRHRAATAPQQLSRERIIAIATRAANRLAIRDVEPRLHWENVAALDGMLLFAEQTGGNATLIDRVASVILGSTDNVSDITWGDRTAFAQVAMDLYRLLPPSDPRRAQLLGLMSGPMAFADRAIHVTPAAGAPKDLWWIDGGYGTRFWQDDMYMVIPWLAMYGSTKDGLPGNAQARDLAHEWLEAYVYDHRPASGDARERAVPSSRARNGFLLWDPQHELFQHGAETIGSDNFWGRGNGWTVMALARTAEYLDASYTGGRYDQVVDAAQIHQLLAAMARSLVARRTPDGGWPQNLSRPEECGVAETSATGFITFFLARGINEGWLDRATYEPIVMQAFDLLLQRVDGNGVMVGIQQPGFSPACETQTVSSNHPTFNVNYGVGGVLLAASEVLKF